MREIKKVSAIIVTYNPDQKKIEYLIQYLKNTVYRVYVFDNNSQTKPVIKNSDIIKIFFKKNIGLAGAHNYCMIKAFNTGSDAVLLFDQDSQPSHDMVRNLLKALNKLRENPGAKVAAVGPLLKDPRSGYAIPFFQYSDHGVNLIDASRHNSLAVESDYLITSGSLIPRDAWLRAGDMKEDFFIDCVDIEWGLRAKHMGWLSYVVPSAGMNQFIGDDVIKVPFTRRIISLHSPRRYYFMTRNTLHMLRMEHIPKQYKISLTRDLILRSIFILCGAKGRFTNLKHMIRGAFHALAGRTGPF